MEKSHEIKNIKFEGGFLVITIDGKINRFELKAISPALEKASAMEQSCFEISPSGYGIYWPLIDEDLSIDGLLGIVHAPQWSKKTA